MRAELRQLQRKAVTIRASSLAAPVISYDAVKELWRLEEDYACVHAGTTITVPTGFEFDLASVPRPLWWLISPFDLSIAAPLIHDLLYHYAWSPPHGHMGPTFTDERLHNTGVSWGSTTSAHAL